MNAIPVVVLPEFHEFPLKVLSIPKDDVIKLFTTNGSDESCNVGVRLSSHVRLFPGAVAQGVVLVFAKEFSGL
jgi:hypothetical protein